MRFTGCVIAGVYLAVTAHTQSQAPQRQSITSSGDHNLNLNADRSKLDIVAPTINESTKVYLQQKLITVHKDPNSWKGTLLPGNTRSDYKACEDMAKIYGGSFSIGNDLAIQAGSNTFICRADLCSIIGTRNEELITVRREGDFLHVTGKVLTEDGNMIVGLERNKFRVNWNQVDRRPERTKSGLTIFDQKDQKVLHLEFLNKHAVRIAGIFNDGHGHHLDVEDDAITAPNNNTIKDSCAYVESQPSQNGRHAAFGIEPFVLGRPLSPAATQK